MPSALWTKENYSTPFSYIAADICEYDISKANISVLTDSGYMNEKDYNYYASMPKMHREIAIGNMIKASPGFGGAIKDGFSNARRCFFELNSLEDKDIISIKKDAIFTTRPVTYTVIGHHTEFKLKGRYSSYLSTMKKEFYYFYNRATKEEYYSIKGFSEQSIELHRQYFLDFILAVLNTAQINEPSVVLELIRNFYMQYVTLQLPIGYYRRFDSNAYFEFAQMALVSNFQAMFLDEKYKSYLDISYNESIIRQLEKTFASIYFIKAV